MTDTVRVSRGRDTYGYNMVTLSSDTGKRFRVMGGGYDMHGQVMGEYVQFIESPDRLRAVADADDTLPVTVTPDDKVTIIGWRTKMRKRYGDGYKYPPWGNLPYWTRTKS